jgi:hypothetical protein
MECRIYIEKDLVLNFMQASNILRFEKENLILIAETFSYQVLENNHINYTAIETKGIGERFVAMIFLKR